MPRVIQPGGGGGKMRDPRAGSVASLPHKRMQAEGMSLHATASDCVLTPPAKKIDQNPLIK